jgi:hypothetical protein
VATYGNIDRDLMAYLTKETTEIARKSKSLCKKHARKCAEKISQASPKDSGDYVKGWGTKNEYENSWACETIVYNKKKPTLTWLLEKGHIASDGSRTKAYPHIEKNEEAQAKEFYDDIQKLV